jgi:hypothetical protein
MTRNAMKSVRASAAGPESARRVRAERYGHEVRGRLGWNPQPGQFHLFRVDIEDVTFIRYEQRSGDQFVTRWPDRREFVRRGSTDTSLGAPEPSEDLLRGG